MIQMILQYFEVILLPGLLFIMGQLFKLSRVRVAKSSRIVDVDHKGIKLFKE